MKPRGSTPGFFLLAGFLICSLVLIPDLPAAQMYRADERTYNFEIGSAWEKQNLYWLGGNAGWRLNSQEHVVANSKAYYLDFIGGASGRDGLTLGYAMGGPRIQWGIQSRGYSPFARLFAGGIQIRDDSRDRNRFGVGVGAGIVFAIQDQLDVTFESRVGHADRLWSQVSVGLSLKWDKWVLFYAKKAKEIGLRTYEITEGVVKDGVQAPGKAWNWMTEGAGSEEEKKNDGDAK